MGQSTACVQANDDVGQKSCTTGEQGYVWGKCEPASCSGASIACKTKDGHDGLAACREGKTASACGVVIDCKPGDVKQCPDGPVGNLTAGCMLDSNGWEYGPAACSTPLVFAFHGESVRFTRAPGEFDLVGGGARLETDWVGASTPWLALDRDGNGTIDDGRELFGSMTELPIGIRASNGFVALAALDENGDGFITSADSGFSRLLLWSDRDQDRRSSPAELTRAEDAGIVAIALDYRSEARCSGGNCEIERAKFVFRDERDAEQDGQVVDVHFSTR
jgi:hypothetical protein